MELSVMVISCCYCLFAWHRSGSRAAAKSLVGNDGVNTELIWHLSTTAIGTN
jgi:hypothetical protein